MSHSPRKVARVHKVNGLDVVVLLYHLYEFTQREEHYDAFRSFEELLRRLNFNLRIPNSVLEAALYCCNLMDEDKDMEFRDIKGRSFDEFVKQVGKGLKFNRDYNYFEGEYRDA